MAPPDRERFRFAMGHFASGVAVVTSSDADINHGATISAVSSVSLDPPQLLVCLNTRSATCKAITETGYFVLHILSAEQEALAFHFAAPAGDKFSDEVGRRDEAGHFFLHEALVHMRCRVSETLTGGTHRVFIAHVETLEVEDGDPLVYFRGKFGKFNPG
ncbi:flavin reductase family protein [Komagataeibacter xylinus]|uniref:Flavin reductase family protein n=2 Tax=Komagataeibacter xylinus TaxID=28448 RepID=A0A857FWJ0_KOMXY|nr:flavin reductase family protein [Komagataeibacter xylinus]